MAVDGQSLVTSLLRSGGAAAWGEGPAFPAPSQAAEFISNASDLSAGFTLQAYSLASMPCGNFTRKTSMPCF